MYAHTHTYIYIYIYIYTSVCVCVCARVCDITLCAQHGSIQNLPNLLRCIYVIFKNHSSNSLWKNYRLLAIASFPLGGFFLTHL